MVFLLPLSPWSALFLLAGGLLLAVVGVTLQTETQTRVTDWFLVVLTADTLWAFSSVIPLEAGTASVAFIGEVVRLTASSVAALVWLCFAVVYVGRGAMLTRGRFLALATPFFILLVAFVTNPVHELAVHSLAISVRPGTTVVSYDIGPVFLLVTIYSLVVTLVATALVVRAAITDPDLYADQSLSLLVGAIMPIAGVGLTVVGVADVGSTNLTPTLLTVTAIGCGYALFRTDLLTTGPLIAAEGRELAVDSLEEGFLVTDGPGRVVEANAAARQLLATSDPVGKPIEALLPAMADRRIGRHTVRTNGGTVLEAQVTSLSGSDGREGVGRVVTLRDVTEQRRQQERLQVLNRVIRHNLRNDLNVVRSFAEQITDGLSDELDDDEAARKILDRTDDLLTVVEKARVVEQLLDDESLSSRAPVELSSLLTTRATEIAAATDRPVEVDTDLPGECSIDSNRAVLEMIVSELLENAVQHNESPEPTVRVSVTVDAEVRIRIADDGPGIPKQDREAVLSGTETKLEHGSQIGLWTVRWGARYLGGSLSIEDRSPTGTVVEVTVPNDTAEQLTG